jgi:hypothetical protein
MILYVQESSKGDLKEVPYFYPSRLVENHVMYTNWIPSLGFCSGATECFYNLEKLSNQTFVDLLVVLRAMLKVGASKAFI